MKDLTETKTLMTRISAEVTMYGFRVVAAALAQVAYHKADVFRKQIGDEVNATRWEVTARSIMTACEVIPPHKLIDYDVKSVPYGTAKTTPVRT